MDKVEKIKGNWLSKVKIHLAVSIALICATLILEGLILRTLPIYNNTIGSFLLIKDLLMQATVLIALVAVLWKTLKYKGIGSYIIYYGWTFFLCAASLILNLNEGLDLDVGYTWVAEKASLNLLNIQYLNGYSIIFAFILALMFLAIGTRFRYFTGSDGKRHIYAQSKMAALFRTINLSENENVGKDIDYPVIVDRLVVTEEDRYGRHLENTEENRPMAKYNDWIRVNSLAFMAWFMVKTGLAMLVASVLSENIAMRFLTLQKYVADSGVSWSSLAFNYLSIFWMRLKGGVDVPTDFAIINAPTFELYSLAESILFLYVIIKVIKIALGIAAKIAIIMGVKRYYNIFALCLDILSGLFAMIALAAVTSIIGIGKDVFDAATPFSKWQTIVWFIVFGLLSLVFRYMSRHHETENFVKKIISLHKNDNANIARTIGILLVLIGLIYIPAIYGYVSVGSKMQGHQYEYQFLPAILPSIIWEQWAYNVDDVQRLNISAITISGKEVVGESRLFNDYAAKKNMKPGIGNINWMSILPSDVDIVIRKTNGKIREYWVSILTLVSPDYSGKDVDVFRTKTSILTHSEKFVAIDAVSSEQVDIKEVFGVNDTPQFYYGEGGLWKETDVYVGISRFEESHLPNYAGPISYDDKPDYVYRGYWRGYKFYLQGMRDYAEGDYGDIKTLTDRDIHKRVSKILLPGMKQEADIQPVWDQNGKMYALVWITIERDAPHGFAGYPDMIEDKIIRRFATVIVSYKNGSIDGYLFKKNKDDYVLSFYRSYYSGWDKPMPEWLEEQLRNPEQFMDEQIRIYNEAFQTDFQKQMKNEFYELTKDKKGGEVIESIRYIMTPLNGELTWSAERLVEPYDAETRNLAGMYLAPGGNRTGELYFIDFKDKNIIGPATALETVSGIPELTNYPGFKNWIHGNILLYSAGKKQFYVIPFYADSESMLIPQMVAVVDAQSKAGGAYILRNTADYREISMSAVYAFEKIGVMLTPEEAMVIGKAIFSGTITSKEDYTQSGNTRWVIGIKSNNSISDLLAKAETLGFEDIKKLLHMEVGNNVSVTVNSNQTIQSVVSVNG